MKALLAHTARLEQALADAQARLTAEDTPSDAQARRQLSVVENAVPQVTQTLNIRQHIAARKDALICAAAEAGHAIHCVTCPQVLSMAKGIGSTFEKRLYEAGIGTFWELANLPDEDFRLVLALDDRLPLRTDFQAIRDDARRLAVETDTVDRIWQGPPPDDFEPLEGIGEVFKRRLYAAGICTFEALADATVEQLTAICPPSRLRTPNYADWIAQARILAQQKQARKSEQSG
jgi:predicted flap endonuclease-1-like 5' DNA nuclease